MKNKRDIYKIKTEHPQGFNKTEIEELLKEYPGINMDKFNSALSGITCLVDPEEGIIIYHCDIELAVRCGLENRDLNSTEWD